MDNDKYHLKNEDHMHNTSENHSDDLTNKDFSSHEPQLMNDHRDEEVAQELTPELENEEHLEEDDIDMGIKANSVIGWLALLLAVISFFALPVIFGGAAIILGFIARNRHAEWLGNTSIAAGIVSIVISLFIIPFV